MIDITEAFRPGIYQVECKKTKKSFFGESTNIFINLSIIYND